jgi:hypothetical protein
VAGIPARLRQRGPWPETTDACNFFEIDDEAMLARAYVEAFIAGLPVTLQPSACTELRARFEFAPMGCP